MPTWQVEQYSTDVAEIDNIFVCLGMLLLYHIVSISLPSPREISILKYLATPCDFEVFNLQRFKSKAPDQCRYPEASRGPPPGHDQRSTGSTGESLGFADGFVHKWRYPSGAKVTQSYAKAVPEGGEAALSRMQSVEVLSILLT